MVPDPGEPLRLAKPTAVRPVTAAIGLVVCSGNAVYRTKDGGRHWKRMTRRAGTGTPRELDRSPDGRLWLALPHSLKVSTDLGVHWRARTELGTGASAPRSLSFPGLKTGYLTRLCTDGTSDLVRSNDRGTTWHEQPRAAGPVSSETWPRKRPRPTSRSGRSHAVARYAPSRATWSAILRDPSASSAIPVDGVPGDERVEVVRASVARSSAPDAP